MSSLFQQPHTNSSNPLFGNQRRMDQDESDDDDDYVDDPRMNPQHSHESDNESVSSKRSHDSARSVSFTNKKTLQTLATQFRGSNKPATFVKKVGSVQVTPMKQQRRIKKHSSNNDDVSMDRSSQSKTGNVFSQLSGNQEVPSQQTPEPSAEKIQTSAQYHANKIQEEIQRMYEFLENKNQLLPDWRYKLQKSLNLKHRQLKNVIDGRQPCLLINDIEFVDWTYSTQFTTNKFAYECSAYPDLLAYLPKKLGISDNEELTINSIDPEIWGSQKSFISTIFKHIKPKEFERITNEKLITSLLGGAQTYMNKDFWDFTDYTKMLPQEIQEEYYGPNSQKCLTQKKEIYANSNYGFDKMMERARDYQLNAVEEVTDPHQIISLKRKRKERNTIDLDAPFTDRNGDITIDSDDEPNNESRIKKSKMKIFNKKIGSLNLRGINMPSDDSCVPILSDEEEDLTFLSETKSNTKAGIKPEKKKYILVRKTKKRRDKTPIEIDIDDNLIQGGSINENIEKSPENSLDKDLDDYMSDDKQLNNILSKDNNNCNNIKSKLINNHNNIDDDFNEEEMDKFLNASFDDM